MQSICMADHYERAVELLEDIDALADELQDAHKAGADRAAIADIHGDLSRSLKLADIHATLSVRQAVLDGGVAS